MFTNENLKAVALMMSVSELATQIMKHGIMSESEFKLFVADKSEDEKKILFMSNSRPVVYRNECRTVVGCKDLEGHTLVERFDENGNVASCYDFGSVDVYAVTIPGTKTAQVEVVGEDVSIIIHSNGTTYYKFN